MKFEKDFFEILENITRFEFIDDNGRKVVTYLNSGETFKISVQDDGKTLKLFYCKEKEKEEA